MNKICGFFGDYRFLSNYFEQKFIYKGLEFKTCEHAFQFCKVDGAKDLPIDNPLSWRAKILNAKTPSETKRLGRQCPMRSNWDDTKLDIVKELITEKFKQNPHLLKMLKATGDAYLEETNSWNDKFWGVCNGEGQNHLGKILMEIREEL